MLLVFNLLLKLRLQGKDLNVTWRMERYCELTFWRDKCIDLRRKKKSLFLLFWAASQRVNIAFPVQCNQLRSNDFSLELALTKFCRSIISGFLCLKNILQATYVFLPYQEQEQPHESCLHLQFWIQSNYHQIKWHNFSFFLFIIYC